MSQKQVRSCCVAPCRVARRYLCSPPPCWILPLLNQGGPLRFVSAPHDTARTARPPAAAMQHADARGELEGALNNALTQEGPARLLSGLPPGMAATGAGPGASW